MDPMRTNLFICQFCEHIWILIPTLDIAFTGTKGCKEVAGIHICLSLFFLHIKVGTLFSGRTFEM